MNKHKTFETERLMLRHVSMEDAEFIMELFNTPKFIKYTGDRKVKTIESSKNYIETKMLPQLERLGFSSYVVIRKADNHKMGTCGLFDREGLDGIDIGFAFLPAYEKKGCAFEAASKMKEAAFEVFGIEEISAITVKENISSQKLLEKIGMDLTGTTKLPDDEEELLVYKIEK